MVILFFFINNGFQLKDLLYEKKNLIQIQNSLKKRILEKEVIFKKYSEELEKREQKKGNVKYDEFIFNGTEDVFNYLNNLNQKNNLILETIGRETLENINGKIYGSFYYEVYGSELGIYNFIAELEEEEKFIALKMDSILIEISEVELYLKANVMYIINNKKNKIDYHYYNEGVFKKFKNRNIEGKRRIL
ncbi:MAG: hypothetical protein ACRCU8_05720 [Cetobacterium sp.]